MASSTYDNRELPDGGEILKLKEVSEKLEENNKYRAVKVPAFFCCHSHIHKDNHVTTRVIIY